MRKTIQSTIPAILLLFAYTPAAAQVSITGSDFLGLIGESQLVTEYSGDSGPVTVNVGSAGANQSWDFSGLQLTGDMYTRSFASPAGSPFADQFPTANVVFSSAFPQDTVTFYSYQYAFVDNSAYTELGNVIDFGDSTYVDISDEPSVINLPVTMNSTWMDVSRDTLDFGAGFKNISLDSSMTVADAWGTLTTGFGTIDVLRLRSDYVYISATYTNDVLVFADTSSSISYEWVSPEHFVVVSIESADGETDPNFTDAEYVSMVTSITTAIEPDEVDLSDGMLKALYPNPFVATLTIDYDASASNIDLGVYDILGRRIRTLATTTAAGLKTAMWDGRTDGGSRAAPGVYLVRIEAGNKVEARQVVLAR